MLDSTLKVVTDRTYHCSECRRIPLLLRIIFYLFLFLFLRCNPHRVAEQPEEDFLSLIQEDIKKIFRENRTWKESINKGKECLEKIELSLCEHNKNKLIKLRKVAKEIMEELSKVTKNVSAVFKRESVEKSHVKNILIHWDAYLSNNLSNKERYSIWKEECGHGYPCLEILCG